MIHQTPAKPYSGNLQKDCAAAMDPHPEVTIDWPGHDFHGRTGRFFGRVLGDKKGVIHIEDHVHLMAPLDCIIVKPRAEVAACKACN